MEPKPKVFAALPDMGPTFEIKERFAGFIGQNHQVPTDQVQKYCQKHLKCISQKNH
jgi:hypothetical protein